MNSNEPIILGKVKKGAAGKPIVVIIVFLFIGAILLFLPTIINYFGDYNIMDLAKNGQLIDFFINHNNYVDTPITNNKNDKTEEEKIEPLLLNSKTTIKTDEFTLNNFSLKKDSIKFTINVTKKTNFDELNYYLILSQNDKEITKIKITDTIINTKEFTFKYKKSLENTLNIKGIIKNIRESEYPNYLVSSDESGLGSLICKKDEYQIEYILNNNKLIKIRENFNYLDNGNNYIKTFEEYTKMVNKLNNDNQIATITENYSGFIYTSEIDLSTFNNRDRNYNYYSLNTKTTKIHFEMNAKGYDCK